MDTLWINDLAHVSRQHFNDLFAECLYMAMGAGFCPAHAYWRDDVSQAEYYSVQMGSGEGAIAPDTSDEAGFMRSMGMTGRGMIDTFVGNPFDTVFDRGATRRSIRWCSYGRVLPAAAVREAFGHIPGVEGLEGSTRIPSASVFQRIARKWNLQGAGQHGSPVVSHRRSGPDEGDELMTVICREIAPGVDPEWPRGRLQVVAVPGHFDSRGAQDVSGRSFLLADQPLPGGTFSFSIFYSHHRGNDVHGKPWIEDVDPLQVDLNIAKSKRWEVINRMAEAPIVTPGGMISDMMTDVGGYNILEVDQSLASWQPRVMQWSPEVLQALNEEIRDLRQAIYTGGGYQAVSRGESPGSRTPYRSIVALQEADRTIHGPVNQRFQHSANEFARRCWAQFKAYGDVGWVVQNSGDEYEHLAGAYVDKTRLSDEPPRYTLVNGFGATPELQKQEVLELVQLQGADGTPMLATEEARKAYPNQTIFDDTARPAQTARRRARVVASAIVDGARELREQTGHEPHSMADPGVQQLGQILFHQIEQEYPRLRDDDLMSHLDALSELIQDESADPVARIAGQHRQELYYQWQAQMAGQPVQGGEQAPQGEVAGPEGPEIDRMAIAAEAQGGQPSAGHGGAAQ